MPEIVCINREDSAILNAAWRNGGRLCWRATGQGISRRGSSRRWSTRAEGTQLPSLSPSSIGSIDPSMPSKTHRDNARKTRKQAVPVCHLAILKERPKPRVFLRCGRSSTKPLPRPVSFPRLSRSLWSLLSFGSLRSTLAHFSQNGPLLPQAIPVPQLCFIVCFTQRMWSPLTERVRKRHRGTLGDAAVESSKGSASP